MASVELAQVRIVLVEPAGPRNIGSVARALKNFGLVHLVLVNPQTDPLGPEARQMAVHGLDVLEAHQTVPDLAVALGACRRAVATAGRVAPQARPLEDLTGLVPWLLADDYPVALVFGPEDRGLSNEELQTCQRWACLPTHPAYPSLNLAQAVGICAYELYRYAAGRPAPPPARSLAPLYDQEAYLADLTHLLLRVGYLYPHTTTRRLEKLRDLLHRASPSPEELALLRGMIRQVTWALDQPNVPKP
ncbi:MAG: RNA methyltransferase [Gloeomargaritaceae cyanobacterium C42_A2020_066]|nr:RNA methyltransferase [Gloeomargaritaceae cyanobacterium C42_A2020_066]